MKSYFSWMIKDSGFLRWNLHLVKTVEMTLNDWFSVPSAAGLTSPLLKKDLGCTSQCLPQHLVQMFSFLLSLILNPLSEEQFSKASCWKASCPRPSAMQKFQYFMHHRGSENTLRLEGEQFCMRWRKMR